MIYKITCSTLMIFIFIQVVAEARVPRKNLYEQHVEFLTENQNKTITKFDNIYYNVVEIVNMKLSPFNMNDEARHRCGLIITKLINLYVEIREKFNDCVESALQNIDKKTIKYWQYEERRKQFMICGKELSDNYNKTATSLMPTNSQCGN